MRTESPHPGNVILDYSRSAARRRAVVRWARTFWSHEARLELAQAATFKQGLAVLAGISAVAGVLSTTHVCIRLLIAHSIGAPSPLAVLRHHVVEYWPLALGGVLAFAPIVFGVLVGTLSLLSALWARLVRHGAEWSRAFPVLSVGCVPLLWFFVLLQLEGVAPFLGRGQVIMWNPVSNCIRFAVLMIGTVLLVAWIIDAVRIYSAIRERSAGG